MSSTDSSSPAVPAAPITDLDAALRELLGAEVIDPSGTVTYWTKAEEERAEAAFREADRLDAEADARTAAAGGKRSWADCLTDDERLQKYGVEHPLALEELAAARTALAATQTAGNGGKKKPLDARHYLDLIRADYAIGRSTDGLLYAVPTYAGGLRTAREIKTLRPEVLRRITSSQDAVPGKDAIAAALDVLEAHATDLDPTPVALRAAQTDDGIVLDLADSTGRVVVITAAGWEVREASADLPLFRRSEATAALPTPERGGTPDVLRELLGLDADDRRWLLTRGWLAASLFADIPRPILWATGPQGSGKSTRARMILSVVEPVEALGKEPGRNERDDATSARGRFIPSWDNLTNVSQATSDWLCRLVTGVTDDRRALYSDGDLRPVFYRRTAVATSLTVPTRLGSDALERMVLVPFDRVPDAERRGERALWERFDASRGLMLGAVLDDVVRILGTLGAIRAAADDEDAVDRIELPRMADYGQVLHALDTALGEDHGHLAAYVGTVDASLASRAEDDPFTAGVIAVLDERGGRFDGTSGAFLTALRKHRPEDATWWPTSVQALTTALVKSSETLRHAGVTYEFRRTKTSRALIVTRTGSPAASGAVSDVPFDVR